MLVGIRDIPDFQEQALLQVYEFILSWPCPACGGAFPCDCDRAEAEVLVASVHKCAKIPEGESNCAGVGSTGAAEPVR
jgi:hypothetical protein